MFRYLERAAMHIQKFIPIAAATTGHVSAGGLARNQKNTQKDSGDK